MFTPLLIMYLATYVAFESKLLDNLVSGPSGAELKEEQTGLQLPASSAWKHNSGLSNILHSMILCHMISYCTILYRNDGVGAPILHVMVLSGF